VTKIAVNIEAMMPIARVTAKPRTGPVPNWKRTKAVSSVVSCASTIAESAWPKPSLTATRGLRPAASSSRMRSKISTLASTAMPMERISPAMPGSVSVAPIPASPASTKST
jgi:hypothetical protein